MSTPKTKMARVSVEAFDQAGKLADELSKKSDRAVSRREVYDYGVRLAAAVTETDPPGPAA